LVQARCSNQSPEKEDKDEGLAQLTIKFNLVDSRTNERVTQYNVFER